MRSLTRIFTAAAIIAGTGAVGAAIIAGVWALGVDGFLAFVGSQC